MNSTYVPFLCTKNKKFVLEPIFSKIPDDQLALDSLLNFANNQRFYSDQIINQENGATFILISIDNKVLNTIVFSWNAESSIVIFF